MMEKAQMQEVYALRATVDDKDLEIARLQGIIARTHVSDVNSLKRAYKSLVQHCGALDLESQGIEQNIRGFKTEIITRDDVSTGLWLGAGVVAFRILSRRASLDVLRVPRELWWFGAAVLGCKLLSGAFRRVHTLVSENRRRKQHLLDDWRTLRERIEIMNALTNWAPHSPPAAESVGIIQPGGQLGTPGFEADAQSRSAAAAAVIEEELGRRAPALG